MIVNILRFSFRDGTTEEQKAEVLRRMRATANVEAVVYSTVGQDLGDPGEGFTHAYCAAIADLAALERYLHDPVHIEGDLAILPYLDRISPIRLSDDPDPDLAEKVMALHLSKVATYPEWGAAIERLSGGQIPAVS